MVVVTNVAHSESTSDWPLDQHLGASWASSGQVRRGSTIRLRDIGLRRLGRQSLGASGLAKLSNFKTGATGTMCCANRGANRGAGNGFVSFGFECASDSRDLSARRMFGQKRAHTPITMRGLSCARSAVDPDVTLRALTHTQGNKLAQYLGRRDFARQPHTGDSLDVERLLL